MNLCYFMCYKHSKSDRLIVLKRQSIIAPFHRILSRSEQNYAVFTTLLYNARFLKWYMIQIIAYKMKKMPHCVCQLFFVQYKEKKTQKLPRTFLGSQQNT